jgi:hypothetical protein
MWGATNSCTDTLAFFPFSPSIGDWALFVLLFFFGLLMDRVFFIFLFLGELFVVGLIDKLSQMNERMNDSIDHKMLVVTDGVGKLQLVLLASFQIAQ